MQSFEVGNLRQLRRTLGRGGNVELVRLLGDPAGHPADRADVTYGKMASPTGLREVAAYADVLGPPVRAVIPLDADGRLSKPTSLVTDAHTAGLKIIPWTFRPENRFLAADFKGGGGDAARSPEGSVAEIRRYLATGIDGFFTDDPALGRRAVDGNGRL